MVTVGFGESGMEQDAATGSSRHSTRAAGTGPPEPGDRVASPDWWPYAGEFPHWHIWRGIAGVLYARRLLSSPPRVLRSQDPVGLRDQIRQAELRF